MLAIAATADALALNAAEAAEMLTQALRPEDRAEAHFRRDIGGLFMVAMEAREAADLAAWGLDPRSSTSC